MPLGSTCAQPRLIIDGGLTRPLAPPTPTPQIKKTAVWRCTHQLLELYNEGLSGCMILRKLQQAEARGELPPLAGFPAGAGAAA